MDNKTGSWRTERPVVNAEKCCRCGWCYLYCPSGCVEEKDGRFEPNFDYCKGCGLCASECPIDAIEMVPERRKKK
ncbi:4Fe-4S binding protein [Chloroflexota bacterium]